MIATPSIEGVTFWGAGGMCPFQAEGTIDGHEFYFRYRHGKATFEADNRQVAESYGDDLKGFLDDPEFASLFTRMVAAWRGEEAPLVLEWPDELGLSWDDGGPLLTFDHGIIRLNPRGVDEWDLSPEEALEMAGQLAAMAALAKRADDLEGVAFGGTTLTPQDGGAA